MPCVKPAFTGCQGTRPKNHDTSRFTVHCKICFHKYRYWLSKGDRDPGPKPSRRLDANDVCPGGHRIYQKARRLKIQMWTCWCCETVNSVGNSKCYMCNYKYGSECVVEWRIIRLRNGGRKADQDSSEDEPAG
ncbi:hypothetical protein EX30DRAFT_340429 [Ascodesmis nigricans]|uniref:RanBP2-type domain-containing protein n=1 Tax=Ascodesmis nigricans TaxID=341454 RepID=A0A4S2MXW3_9PEZI|nr:hypothetical protein EX30DRAFT_340429 [Ascodesmis nigricans]